MGGHLAGAGIGTALGVTAVTGSLAAGLSLSGGGVLVLLSSVLVAARWAGHAAGYVATLTAVIAALVVTASTGEQPSAADGVAVILLGLTGSGISAWIGPASRAGPPSPADPRRVKEEFLATVSHELRTPLNAILGWTELLRMRRAMPPQQVDRGLEVIERNARRELALVDDLLAAVEAESPPEAWQPHDVRALLGSVIDGLQASATTAQVRVVLDTPEGAVLPHTVEPLWIHGDAAGLRLALRHVLDNAIKYSPEGGEVRIRLRPCGGQALIFIDDAGRGIEAERVAHVFEPFNQADTSASRRFGGLGLGLTVARKLIESHHGHVDLSGDGRSDGATVLITLPLMRHTEA